MALFTYIILLAFLNIALAEDCVINNVPEQMAFEKQLRKDLTCDHMIYEPPSNSSGFTVYIKFLLKRFNFNDDVGVLSMQTWMFTTWKDERLKWDPEKYYGINETDIMSYNIWTPGFRLFNSVTSNDFDRFFYEMCNLKNTGKVVCVIRSTHEALCDVKLTKWPYDQQECSLIFGAWTTRRSTHFTMNFSSRAINMFGAEYGADWFISDYKQVANHSSDRQLTMTFVLERESGGLAAIVVYPAVILTVLSMTALFLDVRRFVRLAIACFSLLGHYYFLTELAANMPKLSAEPPNLLFYYRGSVVLTLLIIMFSFLLRILCKWKSTPQSYVISMNDAVFESVGKHFIFPLWDVEDETIDVKRFSQDWTKFANIINCIFSAVIIVTYVSMCSVLVPQPIPITY